MNTITITIERIPGSAEPNLSLTADLLRSVLRTTGLHTTKISYLTIDDATDVVFRPLRKAKASE